MSACYNKFLGKQIDLAPLGICRTTEEDRPYFCTPVGYSLIGWTGVDGIHYCFIRGFGDMVFSVSPCNGPGEYVHPVARSFEDFLRLLLACAGEAAIEQTWAWDRRQFWDFMAGNRPDSEAEATMCLLEQKLGLTPIDDPFAYIKKLQRGFDSSKIKFSKEYEDVVPREEPEKADQPWQVRCAGGGRPGQEIPVEQKFRWGKWDWYVPAVYACGKGLVTDLLVRVEQEEIEELERRWAAATDEAEREQLSGESPFSLNLFGTMDINGRSCPAANCRGTVWYANRPEESDRLGQQMVEHYRLDRSCSWMLYRMEFPWATKGKPKLKRLCLELKADPVSVPGPRFTVRAPGEKVTFVHPITGEKHTLEVISFEDCEMASHLDDPCRRCPDHCRVMEYTITPEPSDHNWQVRDCAFCDEIQFAEQGDTDGAEAAVIGIIGGVDGPTAVMVTAPQEQGDHCTAFSSLHFEPVDEVEWRLLFFVKKVDDLAVKLL